MLISPKNPERSKLDDDIYVSESGDITTSKNRNSGCISCTELYFPPPPAKTSNESDVVEVVVRDDYSNESVIVTNGKIYKTCGKCGKLVRVNKFIIGSLHICA